MEWEPIEKTDVYQRIWKQIEKVNSEIQTVDIKGKQYAEVHQKIKAFRKLYPEGFIKTSIERLENGMVLMRAVVGYGDHIFGTGHAYEKEGSTFINKTSFIENCETSAIGRALSACGIGIDSSVASAEEVLNADLNDNSKDKISIIKAKSLADRCANDGVSINELCELYKVKRIEDLTNLKFANINENWEKICLKSEGKRHGKDEQTTTTDFEIY